MSDLRHSVPHATYVLADHGEPTLADVLRPFVETHGREPAGGRLVSKR